MNILTLYKNECGRHPLLSFEEEKRYASVFHDSESDTERNHAKKILIESNLRFVISVASRYWKRQSVSEMMDIIQAGNLGLITGIEKFDPNRGYRLITYAYHWIRHEIKLWLNESTLIHVPVRISESMQKIQKGHATFTRLYGRIPRERELAEYLKVSLSDVQSLTDYMVHSVSIDETDEEGKPYTNILPSIQNVALEQELDARDALCLCQELLDILPTDLREVIEMLYGLNGHQPLYLRDIGQRLGCSHEWINQKHKKALRIMFRAAQQNKDACFWNG
ncbi:MAG: sigma-70 family RNA polymerase sigma factor [Minisyncoccota bacterium]